MTSRQKSCYSCASGKRKCDRGLPRCRRCITKGIECEYTGKTRAHGADNTEIVQGPSTELAEFAAIGSVLDSFQWQQDAQASSFMPFVTEPLVQLRYGPLDLPSFTGTECLAPDVLENLMMDRDPADSRMISGAWYQPVADFVAKRIAQIPRSFAEKAQTIFIHRCVLQTQNSQTLQDALSMCALYCMRTSDNQKVLYGILEDRVKQLTITMNVLRVSRSELLVRVQALLLYQIIRLFDGDIRLRTEAEADEITLLSWTSELKSRMQTIEPSSSSLANALYTVAAVPSNWLHWLFEESVRRTVFTVTMVKALYDFLKHGFDEVSEDRLCFTAQAALWNAQSEYSWRTAWHKHERLEVRSSNWTHDIEKATPNDLEELGVLTMVSIWGLESSVEWLGQDRVAEYGLQ